MADYTLKARLTADAREFVDGINKAKKEVGKLENFSKSIGTKFTSLGKQLSGLGTSLTNKITKPALFAGAAVGGITAALGWKRLVGLDSAKAQLEGLGYSTEEVGRITDQVTSAIDGGMTTMAEGTSVAAGALAAGVEEGKELEKYIKLVGDAAVGANRPVDEMAQIFNRVQGQGKLMTQELNMIEMGMPGFAQAMADSLADGSLESFRQMVTNGEVGSEEFINVMEDFAGGMAEAYSKSWAGMAKNTLAYVGIIGESLLEGVFQMSKEELASFIELLKSDAVMDWATQTGEKLREAFVKVRDTLVDLKGKWDAMSPAIQSLAIKIAAFGSVALIAIGPVLKIVGTLMEVFGFLSTSIIPRVITAFELIGPAITLLSGPVGWIIAAIALIVAAFITLYTKVDYFREIVDAAFSSVKETIVEVSEAIVGFVMEIWGELVNWWEENHDLIQGTSETVWNAIGDIIEKVMYFIGPLIENVWTEIKLKTEIVWAAIKAAIGIALDLILGIIKVTMQLINGDWSGAWETVKETGKKIWNRIKTMISGIVDALKKNLGDKFQEAKNDITNKIQQTKQNAVNKFQEMKENISTKVQGIVSTVKEKFNDVKEKIISPIKSAKETISGYIEDIKGFFDNLELKIPKPTIPKVSVSKGTKSFFGASVPYPKFSVNWNAQGGIFNKPTLFNTANAGMQGVGEAGSEAILPLNSKVLGGIGQGIARTMKPNENEQTTEEQSKQPVVVNIYDNKEAVRAYVNENNAVESEIRRF